MNGNDKFAAILGFAKRAGKVVYGYDSLRTARNVKLYAVSDTGSENLKQSMIKLAAAHGQPLVYAAALEKVAGGNCKALGVTDAGMAAGMVEYVKGGATDYRI